MNISNIYNLDLNIKITNFYNTYSNNDFVINASPFYSDQPYGD